MARVCINKRECILGKVVNKKIELSEFGEFVETEIMKPPTPTSQPTPTPTPSHQRWYNMWVEIGYKDNLIRD
jgi:hypothetical protein